MKHNLKSISYNIIDIKNYQTKEKNKLRSLILPNPLKETVNSRELSHCRAVNSISISGMLTGKWNVKPMWPLMEGNFVRQFQSPTRSCTSVFSHPCGFLFSSEMFSFKIQTKYFFKDRNEFKNFKYISTKSNRVTVHTFSRKQITKLTRKLTKRPRKITLGIY